MNFLLRDRAKLRVGVSAIVTSYPASTGVGRTWHSVLAELRRAGIRVVVSEPGRHHRSGHLDVWLGDGHQGALATELPTVIHLQEAPWEDPAQRRFFDVEFFERYRRTSAEAAAQANRIITPSRSSKLQIVAAYRVDADTVHVAPHGVDTGIYRPEAAPRGRRLIVEMGGRLPYVLFVSTIHPRKNLQGLRTAMVGLADRGHPHLLVMVIAPPVDRADAAALEREAIAELPGHPGRVLVLRDLPDDDLAGVMAAADVLCAPSFSEGFGFAPLEAMASSTAVIVSDRGSLPEVVGNAGVVTTPAAGDIEEALVQVLSDKALRSKLGASGRNRSLNFTWQRTAATWMEALRMAAGAR